MATLPRSSKSPVSSSFLRPQSEFDAGINTSTAWTQHRRVSGSLSDDEQVDDDSSGDRRPARALYDFEGKPEFRELTVQAGDELEVVKEELADGWSLVSDVNGEIGLVPRSYYIFTAEFTSVPDPDITSPTSSSTASKFRRKRDASSSSITPRNSVATPESTSPIVPQHTGEWMFPSFRQSLLGGKSLNRFSSFVTSGAEEWVLKGKAADTTITPATGSGSEGTWSSHSFHEKLTSITSDGAGEAAEDDEEEIEPDLVHPAGEKTSDGSRLSRLSLQDADRHYVDAGHTWKSKLPPFRILVHSPSKRTSILSGAYTVYNVTSLFEAPSSRFGTDDRDDNPPASPTRLTVQRRFSHFVILHTALSRRLPGIALPPLPEKQYAGRFSDDFVEARRGDLERYIGRIVRHPILRYAEVVTWFLSCESDSEWKRLASYHLSQPAAGPLFYAHVFHPAFNLDLEDAEEAVERFATHTRAVGKGVQGLRSIFGKVREARIEMSKSERLLSYSLLSLITSKPLASTGQTAQTAGIVEEEDEEESPNVNGTLRPQDRYKGKGVMNEDGAWCWREGCQDCLALTKALQRTAETLQSVADIYDDHARRTQLATHESLKSVAHPASVYAGVVSTHRSTVTRYREAGNSDEEMASRCETVLNTTMAEMETYHTQKVEDFATLAKEHLDGEIAMYAQILNRLQTARAAFSSSQSPTSLPPTASQSSLSSPTAPRQPSIYERELENPRLNPAPLLQPCPHVFDSTPMRPVSVAVGSLLGGAYKGSEGRGSMLGNLFW